MGKTKYKNLEGKVIGIYKILYECKNERKSGRRVFYVKCIHCGWEGKQKIDNILKSKKCVHQYSVPDSNSDLGIYTNIRKSKNKCKDGRHSLYYADCKVCGKTVERTLYDLRHFNRICQHRNVLNGDLQGLEIISSTKDYSQENHLYYKRVYDMWRHMLYRTSPEFWKKYPTYTGTTVCNEWLSFDNFYEDIKALPNYEEWKNNYGKRMMLDKDVLGNGQKLYSKETCCFLTHADSNRDVIKRHPENLDKLHEGGLRKNKETQQPIKAINIKTKEQIEFDSIKQCARELHLSSGNIWMCISDEEKYKSHKTCHGWRFEKIN